MRHTSDELAVKMLDALANIERWQERAGSYQTSMEFVRDTLGILLETMLNMPSERAFLLAFNPGGGSISGVAPQEHFANNPQEAIRLFNEKEAADHERELLTKGAIQDATF